MLRSSHRFAATRELRVHGLRERGTRTPRGGGVVRRPGPTGEDTRYRPFNLEKPAAPRRRRVNAIVRNRARVRVNIRANRASERASAARALRADRGARFPG